MLSLIAESVGFLSTRTMHFEMCRLDSMHLFRLEFVIGHSKVTKGEVHFIKYLGKVTK